MGIYDLALQAGKKAKAKVDAGPMGDAAVYGDANAYRTALEKAAYGDAGTQYGQGLDAITRYLAGAGPLADSGAGTALRYRLASQIYGGARNRINSGYAQYLAQLLAQRRAAQYQLNYLQAQKKANSTGIGGFLGGVLGPIGASLIPGLGRSGSDSAEG